MIIVADASPLHYLILIDQAEVLERLYGIVIIPQAVLNELTAAETPPKVQAWLCSQKFWLEVRQLVVPADPALSYLGIGEQESIQMAQELHADALIIDDKKGRAEAAKRNLRVVGTLGVLATAAERRLLHLPEALQRLRQTNFHVSPLILKVLQDRFEAWSKESYSSPRKGSSIPPDPLRCWVELETQLTAFEAINPNLSSEDILRVSKYIDLASSIPFCQTFKHSGQ